MNSKEITSKINLINAQIEQIRNSDLFSENEKDQRISALALELANVQLFINEIEVNNPETI